MKKKTITALLTALCLSSMTACSFQFTANSQAQNADVQETIDISIGKELSDIVNSMDFTNEESVSEGAGKVAEWANNYAENSGYLSEFQTAKLVRVVDGDTIVVDIAGDEYKVRLIGIDTPESVASDEYLERTGKENTEEGKDASEFTKNVLENTETVYLQTDISDTDRYGRLLRYVWLEIPENKESTEEISTKMLNGILLSEGIANAVEYKPDTHYAEVFEQLESDYGKE